MEGPQFSTLAESNLYRNWDCDIIGMTNMPEAKLAREAEICYATVGMVTDYDCWHPGHDHVSVDTIIKVLSDNAQNARNLVKEVIPRIFENIGSYCSQGCQSALDNALITAPEARDPKMIKKLSTVAGRVLLDEQTTLMRVDGVPYRTIWLAEDGWRVKIIDQRELPHKFVITSLETVVDACLLYTSPSPRDKRQSRMPSSA